MRRRWKWAVALPLVAVLLFVAFEAAAVVRAKSRTPEVLAGVQQRPLRLATVPPRWRGWLIAVEDPGFYRHHGVDFSTPGASMTSIPQALVKRLYFVHFKPGLAKIEQSLIARLVLDPAIPKDEQLEIYLNYAGFGRVDGREVRGFEDAARTYHGRAFAQLSDRQYLSLVAMLMAPRDLDPLRHPAENAARVHRIEALLAGRCKPQGLRDVRYAACPSS